ncbi:hypothetical protein PVL29_016028 [Vitis rotundifolia]|uniref:Uncharacterized protein n=1 Tax=Vitis rotundifolia TaxID=103349 RepID=A0AA38ZFA1_VITRO|nr:hypothetical protein PVL29_016028 [Vitis rotundifolia]
MGVVRSTSAQDFLEKGGAIAMNSERHLYCLSLMLALMFDAMSSSSSASQIIRGTIGSTFVSRSTLVKGESAVESCAVLVVEEDAEVEADEDSSSGTDAF